MIRNAVFVTLAVVFGFAAGSALGLPVWLQVGFLVPAMVLFCRLSGEPSPDLRKIIGFAGFLSVFVLLMAWGSKHVPQQDFWYYYLIVLLVAPFGPVLAWLEKRFFPDPKDKGPAESSNGG